MLPAELLLPDELFPPAVELSTPEVEFPAPAVEFPPPTVELVVVALVAEVEFDIVVLFSSTACSLLVLLSTVVELLITVVELELEVELSTTVELDPAVELDPDVEFDPPVELDGVVLLVDGAVELPPALLGAGRRTDDLLTWLHSLMSGLVKSLWYLSANFPFES